MAYVVMLFDPMASNWGRYEIDRVYLDLGKAREYKEQRDAKIREREPNNKYPMLALIKHIEVTE